MKAVRRYGGRAVGLALGAVLTALPPARLTAQADSFPAKPPAPAPLAPVRFPPFHEVGLRNGMTLLVVENHEQPVISVNLSFRAGAIYDAPGKDGTAQLVAQVLTKGTPTRTADQIAAEIEGVGGSLDASSGDDFLTVSTDVLTDHADLAFELLGDVVRRATFPTAELELARTQALSALALSLSQPGSVAMRFFDHEVYGTNPYGRSPTADTYRAITPDDVRQFAAARIRPKGALLVMAGDVTLARARALAQKAFGGWTGTPAASPSLPAPAAKTATDILLVNRPGSVQGNIVLGNATFPPTDPGYYAARIATQILGGGEDARLFLILREQKSWTYGAYANLVRHRGMGEWRATFEGRTEVVDSALAEMLHQVDRMRTEVVPDTELTNVKGFLIGSFPLTIETPQQIASVVGGARLLGLPADYVRTYRERLQAVTAAQVETAAQGTYHRDALTIVVVGDAQKLYQPLKAIAPVRLVDVDGKPLTLADLQPKAEVVDLDRAQFVARRDSFQVVVRDQVMGSMTSAIEVSADSLTYRESTTIAGGMVQQQTTVRFNPADLSVIRVDQTGTTRGQAAETHLTYGAGHVKGTSTTPQPTGTPLTRQIDTTVAVGTYDDNALNVVLPALPLEPGRTFHLGVFVSGKAQTQVMQVKVSEGDTVTVPAGTFHTYRLDIQGGQVPIAIYVTKDAPRHIVKIAYVGAPFVFELVK